MSAAAAPADSRAAAERAARLPASPPALPLAAVPAAARESWTWRTAWERWTSREQLTSLGVSLVTHLVVLAVLAVLALPTLRQAIRAPIYAAAVGDPGPQGFEMSGAFDTDLALPREFSGGATASLVPTMLATDDSVPISQALLVGGSANETGGAGGAGAGDVAGGMNQFMPGNAVRAGSFTAWTTPTFEGTYTRRFGEPEPKPGDSPKPGQPYWITIQIKAPQGRRTYPIRDLKGLVTGTDKYTQEIPEHTYGLSKDGKLIPLRGRTTLPVTDGVVQIVVKVPGAGELVKDTIEVSSKMLGESQTLVLVFE